MPLAFLAVAAYCEAMVEGTGTVDVETDYLPRVVTCENGGAADAALEAQAIAARSYLYAALDLDGTIGDGTGDQVYSCGREPEPQALVAVAATAGQVLRYRDTQVVAFYVAGALQDAPDCVGGADDPTSTERWVTYNEGLSGDAIVQTELGLVDPTNDANRGCMSQNGSDCLAGAGRDAPTILRFYYGADIEIVRAEGDCIASGDGDEGSGFLGGCGCRAAGGDSPPPAGLIVAFLVVTSTAAATRRHRRASRRRPR